MFAQSSFLFTAVLNQAEKVAGNSWKVTVGKTVLCLEAAQPDLRSRQSEAAADEVIGAPFWVLPHSVC